MSATAVHPSLRNSIREYRACQRSAGNRDLNDINDIAGDLLDKVETFLEAHPSGCACPLCRFRAVDAPDLREDLAALAYALRMARGWVANAVLPLDDEGD